MKKSIIILIATMLMSASVFAHVQRNNSELIVSFSKNGFYTVVVDNKRYTASNFCTIDNITPGNHRVTVIYSHSSHHHSASREIYDQWIFFPAFTRIYLDFNKHLSATYRIQPDGCASPVGYNHHSEPHGYQGNGYAVNGYYASQEYGVNGYYQPVMTDSDFNLLCMTIKNTPFDESKKNIVFQTVVHTKLTSNQVYELTQLMTFENTKLEVAKFCYAYTIDKNKYFIVNNAFTFNSSINELNDYIVCMH